MLPLSLALGDYDLHRGLIEGTVGVDGCEVNVVSQQASPERHWRFLRHRDFDACELSLCGYLAAHDRGELTAVPVFPHRRFRHHYFYVRAAAGIASPRDLEGRGVGLRTWQTTAGLWMRGILQHEYGVDLGRLRWVTQSPEEVEFEPPYPLELAPEGKDPEQLLLEGKLDAVLYPDPLPAFQRGDPRVARLFADPKAEEQAYFRRTGIFPIMHVLALRRDLAEANPWLPRNLITAWQRSRALALRRLQNPRSVSLAWLTPLCEEELRILGPDPWEVGLTAGNRKALDAAVGYAAEQGVLRRRIAVEDLFWRGTLEDVPRYVGG